MMRRTVKLALLSLAAGAAVMAVRSRGEIERYRALRDM
jgi:hypothetical protein